VPLEPEVVEAGPARGGARRLWVGVVLLALLAGLASYADARVRDHEDAALTACDAQVHLLTRQFDVRMATMSAWVRGSSAERSGQRQVVDLMAAEARRMLPTAENADRACRAVRVLPWHRAEAAQRSESLAASAVLVTSIVDSVDHGSGR
jgi:hypothetical protein